MLINSSNKDYKNKIKNFYNVENIYYKNNIKLNIPKTKMYDLISIFPYDYKLPNSDKKLNEIIFTILKIFQNILYLIKKDTIVHFHYIHYISANSLDLICILENFFDITFFSEYKLQDIDKINIRI